jgi:di/tricarboxylate transporter
LGALAAILIATMLLTEMISNNAAAVLAFPVAVATAAATGSDPRPFVIAVTMGASLSFLTPIGYQTNLMVYGLGGYRFGDFSRLGAPINLVVVVLALVLIPIAFPL